MTDADTPSVPDLWWSASSGIIGRNPSGYYDRVGIVWFDGKIWWNTVKPQELPADAVKLGDVEDLHADREYFYAEWEKAAHRLADIRGLLDQLDAQRDNPQIRSRMQDGSNAPLHRAFEAGVRYAVGCLRRILDREPGREEPRGRCSRCGQQVPRSQQADHAREHHASCACEECMPIGMDDA